MPGHGRSKSSPQQCDMPWLSRKADLLNSKINVLLYAKTKASRFTEVAAQQLVLLDLQATLQELHRFLATDRHVAGNLFITPDSEGPNSVPCCRIPETESYL